MTFAALSNETIGWTIFIVILIGVVTYTLINILRGAKPELGSEIELAPNRKPYLDDEELEGKKLERALSWAIYSLIIIAIGLPMYWIYEPGRQAGAAEDFNRKFVERGEAMFQPTGDNLQALNCAGCHGPKGVGGVASYPLQNPDGTTSIVEWKAPALNTVLLRYSRQEVTFIITYGRPFSPMPPWGVTGGGPLNDQQVQNLVDYLESIQLTPEQAQQAARDELAKMMQEKNDDGTPKYASEGEALFNMGLDDKFAGGAYSCGRCHTQGWSYAKSFSEVKADSGCGALGPSLCGGSVERQFPAKSSESPCTPADQNATESSSSSSSSASGSGSTSSAPPPCPDPLADQVKFVTEGSVDGKRYGVHGQGSGKMPGFGQRPAEPANETWPGSPGLLFWINGGKDRPAGDGMLPDDLIEQIVIYERGLR
jgi:cytochrome c553